MVVLVGNKSDLTAAAAGTASLNGGGDGGGGGGSSGRETGAGNKRAVTIAEAEEWCRREGVLRYVETSAKSGEGVEEAFLEVAERIFENVVKGRYDLADRRSGVRGPGSGGRRGEGNGGDGSVILGGLAERGAVPVGWGGGCC